MIYGYAVKSDNDFGLLQMREVSLTVEPEDLRDLASFLLATADKLEEANSPNWHRHVPETLRQRLGCDFVIVRPRS